MSITAAPWPVAKKEAEVAADPCCVSPRGGRNRPPTLALRL